MEARTMTVLVTGAGTGFGAAIARRFFAGGSRLIVAGRRRDKLEALRADLGAHVLALALDVRDRAAVEVTFANLPAEFAEIDVLVNNAGLAVGLESAQEADVDDWDRMVDTNVKGLVFTVQKALPLMSEGIDHSHGLGGWEQGLTLKQYLQRHKGRRSLFRADLDDRPEGSGHSRKCNQPWHHRHPRSGTSICGWRSRRTTSEVGCDHDPYGTIGQSGGGR